PLIWACLSEVGNRSLGREVEEEPIVLRQKSITTPPTPPAGLPVLGRPLAAPPPEVIVKPANPPAPKLGPSIPAPAVAAAGTGTDLVIDADDRDERVTTPPPSRGRTPSAQRFRQSQTGTGIGRLANTGNNNNNRRPQAQAQPLTDPTRTKR